MEIEWGSSLRRPEQRGDSGANTGRVRTTSRERDKKRRKILVTKKIITADRFETASLKVTPLRNTTRREPARKPEIRRHGRLERYGVKGRGRNVLRAIPAEHECQRGWTKRQEKRGLIRRGTRKKGVRENPKLSPIGRESPLLKKRSFGTKSRATCDGGAEVFHTRCPG